MMLSTLEFSATLLACMVFSHVLQQQSASRTARATRANIELIDNLLTLIQMLQKHRGLGSQHSSPASFQRERIAQDIAQRWRELETSAPELNYLPAQWQKLERNPADFDGHSQIIKHLLGFIEALANRSDLGAQSHLLATADRCRSLEDLARLRGLSVRAAQLPQCPIELKVPIKYLCENLRSANVLHDKSALQKVLRQIDTQMLDADRTTISASQCFDMLTPLIDSALDEIRTSLHQSRERTDSSKQPRRSAKPNFLNRQTPAY